MNCPGQNYPQSIFIVLDRTHTCCHTALSEISIGNKGCEKNTTTHHLISRTIFLPMWGLQILLFGLRDSLVWRRSTEWQLCEDNEHILFFDMQYISFEWKPQSCCLMKSLPCIVVILRFLPYHFVASYFPHNSAHDIAGATASYNGRSYHIIILGDVTSILPRVYIRHRCIIVNSYSASRDNWCTVGGDGGCRVGEVLAGTTSPMSDHKGFKLQ